MNNEINNVACGVAELPLSIVRVEGNDRATFLHSFCTADINKLGANQFTEAFFLNHKGKTISHGIVVSREIDTLIVSTAKSPQVLMENLDKYLLSQDVQMSDVSTLWRSVFVSGSGSSSALSSAEVQVPVYGAVANSGFQVVLPAELAGQGVLILEPAQGDVQIAVQLAQSGATMLSSESFHELRIEELTPWCDFDITDACLPQEFRRDDKAISFTKGCYLGQETVARLDALGHVNRFFVGFEVLEGEVSPGDEIRSEGKKIGVVTSMSGSKGLGFLRVEFATSGETLDCESVKLKVR